MPTCGEGGSAPVIPVDAFEALLREAAGNLRARLPPRLVVTFRPLTEVYFRTTARGGELRVVVNDSFEDAPWEALVGLADVIVARASGAARSHSVGKAFWDYVETEGLKRRMQTNYLARQRTFVPEPRGKAYDLVRIFDDINERYLDGQLRLPVLAWTLRPITSRWGWYSAMVRPCGLIVINRLLDDARVPRFVLEGTMYHEALHMHLDPELSNGRRRVHTREFYDLERRFERLDDLRPEYRKVLRRYADEARRAARGASMRRSSASSRR